MIFNSFEYFIFLPIIFFIYWILLKNTIKGQNFFLFVSSCLFYGWWDWRFLSLIFASIITDFFIGLKIYNENDLIKRKTWLWVSVIFNVGLLGFFKYFNFFVESWMDLFSSFGYEIKSSWTLKVILPVGISFYTFQTMSYSFDIYYKKLKPTRDFLSFAAFVSFFPQLVAGPIERASNLLPQISNKRIFRYNQIVEGLKLILWGLFKKIVIADSLAPIVDDIFVNYNSYPASTLLLGAFFFSFQIYGDFSGYSDIAIGSAKLFGIELMSNFKFPYFSRSITEFWRRWHISLSTWFQSYIYIPLGGSRVDKLIVIRNIFIIFIISGLWHGANWTFVFWGLIHALIFMPKIMLGLKNNFQKNIIGESSLLPNLKECLDVVLVFLIVMLSWIFFRAESITEALSFFERIICNFSYENYTHPNGFRMIDYYVLIVIFILYEYIIRKDERSPFKFKSKIIRFIAYALVVFMILLFYDDHIDRSFLYFQF